MQRNAMTLMAIMGLTMGGAAQAAVLNVNDLLTIDAGVASYDAYGNYTGVSGGSWFALEGDNNSRIASTEKGPLSPGSDGGILIGHVQSPGEIDTLSFFTYPGNHYTTVAPTGGTTSGIDFSGWAIHWYGLSIAMGDGAWNPLNCGTLGSPCSFSDGVAAFSWSGVYGDSYSLWYTATVPAGDPSGLGGVQYMLHLEGVVMEGIVVDPIPVPAAAWLFGSGLLGLMGVARRRVA